MSVIDRRDFVKSVSAAIGTAALAGIGSVEPRLTRNRERQRIPARKRFTRSSL